MAAAQVFISYSQTGPDKGWVHDFADALQQQGVKVWLDEWRVMPGDSFVEALDEGLRKSDIIVYVISPERLARPSFFFEIGAGVASGKRIVPIVPEGFELSRLPQPLRGRQAIVKRSPEETARELLAKPVAASV